MSILVTGGAGFIGSHTCVELLNAGYEVVVVDNLYNSSKEALKRVEEITGKSVKFYEADIRDKEAMNAIFDKETDVESVIHFAGLKAVGESVAKPIEYYDNNIAGTLVLCDVMRNHGVKNIIFSSSATIYGDPVIYPDHRRVSERNLYKSIRMDEVDAGADLDRFTYGRSGVERSTASLLQSDWSA